MAVSHKIEDITLEEGHFRYLRCLKCRRKETIVGVAKPQKTSQVQGKSSRWSRTMTKRQEDRQKHKLVRGMCSRCRPDWDIIRGKNPDGARSDVVLLVNYDLVTVVSYDGYDSDPYNIVEESSDHGHHIWHIPMSFAEDDIVKKMTPYVSGHLFSIQFHRYVATDMTVIPVGEIPSTKPIGIYGFLMEFDS